MSAILYRKDIDGMRAIAVLAVVLFHAFPAYFKSGFIGVDIFFVISGYLISQGIYRSVANGSYSIFDFYVRRIRRIFPALITVLMFVFIAGYLLYIPTEFESLGKHTIAGALFYSNIQLWLEIDYFDQAANLKPLLHLWSLGVEEQFYIIWPLFIFFLYPKSRFFLYVVVFAVFSFVTNIVVSSFDVSSSFYLPVTRFWELIIGAMVAFIENGDFKKINGVTAKKVSSIFGSLLLLLSFIFIDESFVFPGWIAIVPVLASALIIHGGPAETINRLVIGNRISVFIGILSYPMYLWHWPLLVFSRVLDGGVPSFRVRASLVLLTFVLAYLTYRFVEVPFRYGQLKKYSTRILVTCMLGLCLLGVASQFDVVSNNIPIAQKVDPKLIEAAGDRAFPGVLKLKEIDNFAFYYQENFSGPLFIGDSHIQQYYPILKNISSNKNFVIITEGGCPPFPFDQLAELPECDELMKAINSFTENSSEKLDIFIAACWNCYFSAEGLQGKNDGKIRFNELNQTDEAIGEFVNFAINLSHRHNVTIIGDNPMDHRFDPKFYLDSDGGRLDLLLSSKQEIRSAQSSFKVPSTQILLDERFSAQFRGTNVRYVSILEDICPNFQCDAFDLKGHPIYRDNNHMRPYFVTERLSKVVSDLFEP